MTRQHGYVLGLAQATDVVASSTADSRLPTTAARYALFMSPEHVSPEWLLEAAAQHQQPPKDLGSVASTFLAVLYTDSQWSVVQRELEQLSRDNSIAGILRRQEEALSGIANAYHDEALYRAEVSAEKTRENNERSLAAELRAAEKEFHARVAEIAAQLPEAAKAAKRAPEDSPIAQAATRIARVARSVDLSRLGPYWMLIVLYWLIVHLNMGQLAALTLWYMVASDNLKKKD